MTDFEDTQKYNAIKNQIWRINPDANLKTRKELERALTIKSLDRARRTVAPEYFKQEFTRGFKDGYKNPDKREPITLEMLVEAFDLCPISLN